MMDALIDYAFTGSRAKRALCALVICGVSAFILFVLLMLPFAILGATTWGTVFSGAAGCAIGTGGGNAVFAALRSTPEISRVAKQRRPH